MSSPFDFSFPPFDALNPVERSEIALQIDIEYYAAGSTIIQANSPMAALYVVMKGLVVGGADQDVYIAEQELFDGKALLEGHCSYAFTAQEDTLLWRIPREAVLQLSQRNTTFAAYFYQDVARRMAELSPSPHQLSQATLMLSRVRDASSSPVYYVAADANVLEAAQCLQQHNVSSVLIKTEHGCGIFTQSDLRQVVCNGLIPAQTRVADHASFELHSVDPDTTLHQAMILMIRHGIHRVLIARQGEIIGVLEQLDLLSSLANNPHSIGVQIDRATGLDELKTASARFLPLIQLLQHSGMKVTLIAELVSELRQKLLAKLFTLLAPAEMLPHVCLLVLGSEGRAEQILRTDQDNALIIADGYQHPELETVCLQFNSALTELGYPPCPGGIMASNPEWRQSVGGFKQQINQWTYTPSGENVMKMAIWVDGSAVTGNTSLLYELQEHLKRWLDSNTSFMAHFALPVEHFPTPLGLFSRLVTTGEKNQLDLKKGGIFPITHGLRSLALESRVEAKNSYERLAALSGSAVISSTLAQDIAETLSFLQTLQLKYGLLAHFGGKTTLNLVDPSQLSALERDLLKDALSVVKQFRSLLRHHFKLDRL
ncbi:cyclic nucleotide-binding/CBS domain-containing protein [Chitinibacter fontanus]|uniref:Cyclic nucleotide-binding/CBS domain-containing protein n=1 Tax=Chitinibacter fontanus TaxID=1737446 RepID=A0A7D5V8I8_9NEIS|nr:putative nucleotidyltransferase substrate binding domain-containing protein [Chitinibacter fontanus]QLI80736.1 cyclic nucleotide-binding/CBS domain-containing protein [Chitinibacter fontanus]